MAYIRSAALRGLQELVEELGGDAQRLAADAGLPTSALQSDDVPIADRSAASVLELAAAHLKCPDFGLRLAARQDMTVLGPQAVAMQSARTVGEALACMSRFFFMHALSLELTVIPDPRGRRGRSAVIYGPVSSRAPQVADLGVGFVHRLITYLCDGSYGLFEVELPYRDHIGGGRHQAYFGAPVLFGRPSERAMLTTPRSLLSRPIANANDRVHAQAMAFLERQMNRQQLVSTRNPFTSRVASMAAEALETQLMTIETVSALLAMHPRTLQRHLRDERTNFAHVVDDVRRRKAHELLTTTDLSVGQISRLVGFTEQSALSHAGRRWWNKSPRQVRLDSQRAGSPEVFG
jgi:AraC-like DNA-binding protein